MSQNAQTIRVLCELSKVGPFLQDYRTAGPIRIWRGSSATLQMAFIDLLTLLGTSRMSNWASVKAEIFSSQTSADDALATATVSSGDINTGLALADFRAGTDQHVEFEFTADDTNLDLNGEDEATFWLVISSIDAEVGADWFTLGGGTIQVVEDNTPAPTAGPNQGNNLIPNGATYNGSGVYTVTGLTANRAHKWGKGANDTNVVNGTESPYTATNSTFITQGTSVTLNGTPSALVTATLRYPVILTYDEALAIFALARDYIINRADLAGLTGGSGKLDSLDSTTWSTGVRVIFKHSGINGVMQYRLVESTDAQLVPWKIREYNYTTNATKRHWKLEHIHIEGCPCLPDTSDVTKFWQLAVSGGALGQLEVLITS